MFYGREKRAELDEAKCIDVCFCLALCLFRNGFEPLPVSTAVSACALNPNQ